TRKFICGCIIFALSYGVGTYFYAIAAYKYQRLVEFSFISILTPSVYYVFVALDEDVIKNRALPLTLLGLSIVTLIGGCILLKKDIISPDLMVLCSDVTHLPSLLVFINIVCVVVHPRNYGECVQSSKCLVFEKMAENSERVFLEFSCLLSR
ncbi:hypothetical protein PFISCL1PPCAC_21007, partial [Pristionchus fissidentatus]